MISVFRSVGYEGWRKFNLSNLEESMKILAKLDKQDFLKMILFDPQELRDMNQSEKSS
jgi:flagellar assembly factor FliW